MPFRSDAIPAPSQIFVSYAAEDRDTARHLAGALEADGYAVWWDRLITGGTEWGDAIDRALRESRAVIVLWSPASVRSDYVRAEARHAADRGVLVPACLEACEPPLPFGEYQTVDLTSWRTAPSGGAPPALVDALRRVVDGGGVERVGGSTVSSPALVTVLLRYGTDLFQLAMAPKTFLLARWDEPDRAVNASRFYIATAVLTQLVGLPLVLKLGGSIRWEVFGAFVYDPLRMLALGAVVHLSFRAVGGKTQAVGTLTAFAYLHSLQMLLFECTQGLAVGVLRLAAPAMVDRIFSAVIAGNAGELMRQAVQDAGLGPSALFLALAWWPLFVVPFAGWGAFRLRHQVSPARSTVAAALAVLLGLVTYAASVMLSYANAGPG